MANGASQRGGRRKQLGIDGESFGHTTGASAEVDVADRQDLEPAAAAAHSLPLPPSPLMISIMLLPPFPPWLRVSLTRV